MIVKERGGKHFSIFLQPLDLFANVETMIRQT